MKPYRLIALLSCLAIACGSDDAPTSTSTNPTSDAGAVAADAAPTDLIDAATTTEDCTAATVGLAQTADANAPVLNPATSNLVRVVENDTFCAGHGFGKFPAFGAFGYQLSIDSKDADGDGRTTLDDIQAKDAVRLASDPNIAISTRTDPNHFSGGGTAILIQLCLDKVYAASELAIGFDLSDKAGHRSKAICIRQQSGK